MLRVSAKWVELWEVFHDDDYCYIVISSNYCFCYFCFFDLVGTRGQNLVYRLIYRLGKQKNWIFEDGSWYSDERVLRLMCHDVSFWGCMHG